jgi:hypothetical protein
MATKVQTKTRTLLVWNGDKPAPRGTKIDLSFSQKLQQVQAPQENDSLRPVGKRKLNSIITGYKTFYLRDELPVGRPLTADFLTKRKPREPKYKPGDRVVMLRTVWLDCYGSNLALEPGGVLKVESREITNSGTYRYVLGAYMTAANTEPFDRIERSESCIARLASKDE